MTQARTYTFEVEDKSYTLKYDYNAVCDIEELAGVGIGALVSGDRVGMNSIRLIVWGGLKWRNRGLTKDAAGNIINKFIEQGGDMEELGSKAVILLSQAASNKKAKPVDEEEVEEDLGNAIAEE